MNGKAHLADNDANAAKLDLVHSYNDVEASSSTNCIPTELGGKTLTHGNYNSGSGTFEITGTLTLVANGGIDKCKLKLKRYCLCEKKR